ncbi:MAG: EAL domain-containing protein [Phormidesmis sp.]
MLSSVPQIACSNSNPLIIKSNTSHVSAACRLDTSLAQLTQPTQTLSTQSLSVIKIPTVAGPLSVNTFSIEPSAIGMMLIVSSFSLLLASFWIKIYRLTSLVKRRDQRIRSLLTVDPVTALSNRDHFRQVGELLLRTKPSTAIALLSIRLDDFNSIRSEIGDQASDELLQQISRRLQGCVGPLDTLARTGDDEFSLLIGSRYDVDSSPAERKGLTVNIAKHILGVTYHSFYIQAQKIRIESSIGIALVDSTVLVAPTVDTTTLGRLKQSSIRLDSIRVDKSAAKDHFERLLLQVSIAGAQARAFSVKKEPGEKRRERYAIFQPEMEVTRAAHAQQRQALKAALVRQEMRALYQPIVNLETSETVGFEALVRWQHPQLGLLRPYEFLPLAEKMGLAIEIDQWMLEMACQQLSDWQYEHLYPSVSVNLSGAHLSRLDLIQTVETLLSRYAIDPSQLRVEVTESVMIADSEQAIATLNQLQKMGLRVSLDDFGTGYCSFGYLSQFPVDVLKIDQSFVKGLGKGAAKGIEANGLEQPAPAHTNEAIVRSILALAKDLGIAVIAEGIEHLEQCQWLQQMGCQYGQGNFFAAALTERSAQALLTARPIMAETKAEDVRSPRLWPPRLNSQSQR